MAKPDQITTFAFVPDRDCKSDHVIVLVCQLIGQSLDWLVMCTVLRKVHEPKIKKFVVQ